jgi:hypothetical protein
VEKRAAQVTLLARDHSEFDMNGRREAWVPCRLDDVKRLSIVRGRFGEIASRERGHTQEEQRGANRIRVAHRASDAKRLP